MIKIWNSIGLQEYNPTTGKGHYVIGKQPPLHFEQPLQPIKSCKNVISFINGSYIELMSMDRPGLNLGGNFDYGCFDEVQDMNQEKVEKDYMIATRTTAFLDNPLGNNIYLTGTMPWTASGKWIFKYEKLAQENPEDYMFYLRTSYDNIGLLGNRYFNNLKKILSPLMYAIEIENYHTTILTGGFYPSFTDTHCYTPQSDIKQTANAITFGTSKADYDKSTPLDISFDFGAKVTCLLVAQLGNDNVLRFIDMFAENSLSLTDTDTTGHLLQRVVTRFIKKYGKHQTRINIYGDHTGHNKSDKSETSYVIVENMLKAAKINYTNKVQGKQNPKHAKKYFIINQILSDTIDKCPKIRINKESCKDLILSIQSSPVIDDYQKDKSSERNVNLPPEKQTHYSDAFDYILMGKLSQFVPLEKGSGFSLR
jgi:hypothetical protein